MDSKKILNIMTIAMFVITVVLLGLFLFGGEVPNQQYTTPVFMEPLLNWSYILCGIAIIAAMVFPVIRLLTRPKEAMKSFIGLGIVIVLVLIAYAMADGTPLKLTGYTGPDNIPSMLLFSDTILYTMYFLFIAAILTIVSTEVYKRIK
ncbi:MAG: hypothetical protein RR397_06325 [Odoribacter sp.]